MNNAKHSLTKHGCFEFLKRAAHLMGYTFCDSHLQISFTINCIGKTKLKKNSPGVAHLRNTRLSFHYKQLFANKVDYFTEIQRF